MCIYFLKRIKKGKIYFYCKVKKQEITFNNCSICKQKQYKKLAQIKKKTAQQRKIEKNRYSIITNNFNECYLCNEKKSDIHETIGGCNRIKSIKWGLTIPICRRCHRQLEDDQELKSSIQKLGQKVFEAKYNHELFMQEFKKNYLD